MTAGLGVIEVTEEGGELLENTQRPVERWSPEANWIGGEGRGSAKFLRALGRRTRGHGAELVHTRVKAWP